MNTTHRDFYYLFRLALCLSFVAPTTADDQAIIHDLEGLIKPWKRPEAPGAALVIIRDGRIFYQDAFGLANIEQRVPITMQTVFDAASVAKQFTGFAVATLVTGREITLDDDIRKYLTEIPNFGNAIKIDNLLHHTSGLHDWAPALVLSSGTWSDLIMPERIMELVKHQRELEFPPGEADMYCNTGYNLLAAIVAKVSGKPFSVWTTENIFHPLKMRHSRFLEKPSEIISNLAECYESKPGRGYIRLLDQVYAPGSSSLLTSAEDLGKWLMNLDTAEVGGSDTMKLMRKRGAVKSGRVINYGLGFFLERINDVEIESHGGGWQGFSSAVLHVPSKRFGIAILANDADLNSEKLSWDIARLVLKLPREPEWVDSSKGTAASKTDAGTMEPKDLHQFAGDYWSEELQAVYRIALRNGNLMMRSGLRSWTLLLPKSGDTFQSSRIAELDDIEAKIEFTRNQRGEVIGMGMSARRVRNIQFSRVSLSQR